jgi:hypothetical protein
MGQLKQRAVSAKERAANASLREELGKLLQLDTMRLTRDAHTMTAAHFRGPRLPVCAAVSESV